MRVLVAVPLLLALAAPAHGQTALVRQGRQIAVRDCGACHSVGRGPSPMPQAPPFRVITERYDPDNLAESLAEGISVGHPAMPQVSYPPSGVAAFIAYLRSLQPMRPRVSGK